MKKVTKLILISVASTSLYGNYSHAGVVTTDGADLVINTKSGLEAKTSDGAYTFKLGGRIMVDASTYDGVVNGDDTDSGSDIWFRRARLEVSGTAYDWGYVMSYNLTDSGSIDLAYISYNGWGPWATVTIGQQKEDFGLDDTISSKWTTFVERAMLVNAFETNNNIGTKLSGANDQLTYSIGAYKESTVSTENSLDYAYTGRIVYRPLYEKEGNLIHLGAGYTFRSGDFEDINSTPTRGGQNKKVNKIEAAYIEEAGKEANAFNLEAAVQFGSFNAMAEYFQGELTDHPFAGDLESDGFYVQASYFLTGEHRSYKTTTAIFDKVKPNTAAGAWEVAMRYAELDVSNDDPWIETTGDVAKTYTAGVNWYATELVKFMADYSYVDVSQAIDDEDDGHAVELRAQYAF